MIDLSPRLISGFKETKDLKSVDLDLPEFTQISESMIDFVDDKLELEEAKGQIEKTQT